MARPNDFDRELLEGFSEPMTFEELRAGRHSAPPCRPGVYAVVYAGSGAPRFMTMSTGGWYRGLDPHVPLAELGVRWVTNSRVLYFGKAGGAGLKASLRRRLSAYSRFGLGRKVGHRGGRAIWHIPDSGRLLVCWREERKREPRDVEKALIRRFASHHGRRPFANGQD